jgi:hypothetical protein
MYCLGKVTNRQASQETAKDPRRPVKYGGYYANSTIEKIFGRPYD